MLVAAMWTDAVDLRDFYATSLGRVAQHVIRSRIRALWPDVRGLDVLGLGYVTPYLGPFRAEARRVLAAMPAMQGVVRWPPEGGGLSTMASEIELPFADLSVDRVLLVHALESTEWVRPMMREIWRVLSDSGRLLVVVPNRGGVWAHLERTPFGNGLPYSARQIRRLLAETLFTPLSAAPALYVPPTRSRMVLSSAPAWENIGRRWFTAFAGVIVAEAAKEIYAGETGHAVRRRRAYMPLAQKTPGG